VHRRLLRLPRGIALQHDHADRGALSSFHIAALDGRLNQIDVAWLMSSYAIEIGRQAAAAALGSWSAAGW
jgi:hypothetical protein